MSRVGLSIAISNRAGLRAPSRKRLAVALGAAAGRLGTSRRFAVDVVWVGDSEMRRLNKRFRHRSGATDVLAFAGGEVNGGSGLVRLGEIVCNLELAVRSARSNRNSIEAEAVLYATHGLAHLLGAEDKTRRGRRAMREVEVAGLSAARLRVRGGEWD